MMNNLDSDTNSGFSGTRILASDVQSLVKEAPKGARKGK